MEENKEELEKEQVKNDETIEKEEPKAQEGAKETIHIAEVVSEEKKGLRNNTLCLISFIFSMVGLLIMGIPCGTVAVITGIIGIVKFNAKEENNKWMGIVGLCVGAVDVILVSMYTFSGFSL